MVSQTTKNSILISHTLSPSKTIQLHNNHIINFYIITNTKTTHTSIITHNLKIPTIVNTINLHQNINIKNQLLINKNTNKIIISPSTKQIKTHKQHHQQIINITQKLKMSIINEPIITKNKFKIQLNNNINLIEKFTKQRTQTKQKIKLFHTKYLYLNHSTLPTKQKQIDTYSKILQKTSPFPITIQTLNLNNNKLNIPNTIHNQLNPFFNLQTIHYYLKKKNLFITQLQTLIKTNVHKQLHILIPFITNITKIHQIKILINEIKKTLTKKNIPFNTNIKLNTIIKIPSTTYISNILTHKIQFFSIGTNNLIQYTLTISHKSTNIQYLYHPLHPTMLHMLQ